MAGRVPTAGRQGGVPVRTRVVHGHERAYRKLGSGPVVLLLHGIGDNSDGWLPVMRHLAEHHTVIAPDLLGHGRSAKPRADYSVAAFANGMRDLLDVFGIERATVVGHSLGGGVAAQLAYQYPERVERLVLVATGGVGREVSPILRAASAPYAETLMPALLWGPNRHLARVATEILRRLPVDLARDADNLMRVFDGLPDAASRRAFTLTLRAVVDPKGQLVTMLDRAYLADRIPLLLVWGDRDGIIPVAHAHRAHAEVPGSRLSIYPGAGHFPHHHDPERFVAEVVEFISSTRPALHDPGRRRRMLRRGKPASPVSEIGSVARSS